MSGFIFYLGYFYVFIGATFLLVPIIYLELGKPKDLIRAFFNLLIGLILIIKNKTIDETFFIVFLLFTVLIVLYLVELFFYRWYQLTDNEKKKLKTFLELKNNLSKTLKAINLGLSNFTNLLKNFNFGGSNQNTISKKWVRNNKNDSIKL